MAGEQPQMASDQRHVASEQPLVTNEQPELASEGHSFHGLSSDGRSLFKLLASTQPCEVQQ
eukprot:13502334-Alexandrium_andersonii.AAC.1